MQAIETRWLGPTNTRGSRIVARCEAGRITVPWDYSANPETNHANAARQLAIKLGWTRSNYGSLYGGSIPSLPSGFVWVFVHDDPAKNYGYGGFAPDPVEGRA